MTFTRHSIYADELLGSKLTLPLDVRTKDFK